MDPVSQASTAGSTPVADLVITIFFCAIAFKMIGGGLEEAPEDKNDESRAEFGWLQADMRVPLPELTDLRESCHLIGQHDGHHMYLCGSRQPDDSALSKCAVSADFSKYYGAQVFICQGSKNEMTRA
jgi:hypothetical protein